MLLLIFPTVRLGLLRRFRNLDWAVTLPLVLHLLVGHGHKQFISELGVDLIPAPVLIVGIGEGLFPQILIELPVRMTHNYKKISKTKYIYVYYVCLLCDILYKCVYVL